MLHMPAAHSSWRYPLESHLHELMLQSPHRTLDPDVSCVALLFLFKLCRLPPAVTAQDIRTRNTPLSNFPSPPALAVLHTHIRMQIQEADFFYVPVYAACMMEAVAGWADAPWWQVYRCVGVVLLYECVELEGGGGKECRGLHSSSKNKRRIMQPVELTALLAVVVRS